MPPFGQLNDRSLAIITASHTMSTYTVMDKARSEPITRDEAIGIMGEADFDTLVETGWIDVTDGMVSVSEAGVKHLRSF